MRFFGIDLFDGRVLAGCYLETDIPLEEQMVLIGQDIANVMYEFRGMTVAMDVSWYGALDDLTNPGNIFIVDVAEWGRTEYKIISRVTMGPDLHALKAAMQEAIDFIQSMRTMSFEQIDAFPDLRDDPKRPVRGL